MEINTNDFKDQVIKSDKPVLVEFWASWCLPCQTAVELLKQVDKEIGDKASVKKVNIDKNPTFSSKYDIMGLPTFVLFKNGQEVKRLVGAQTQNNLLDLIKNNLDE